jgi:hypothetical protein
MLVAQESINGLQTLEFLTHLLRMIGRALMVRPSTCARRSQDLNPGALRG